MMITVYGVAEPTSMVLRPQELIEFTGVWLSPDNKGAYAEYDARRAAIATRHGVESVALLPLHLDQGGFLPTVARLEHWKTDAQRVAAASEVTGVLGPQVDGADRVATFTAQVQP